MFVVVSRTDRKRSRRSRDIDLTRLELPDGESVYYVKAAEPESARGAAALIRTIGNAANHIVPQGELILPDMRGIGTIDTFRFRRALLLYEVIAFIQKNELKSAGIKCNDPLFSKKCVCIAKYVRNIGFSAGCGAAAEVFRAKAFGLYGASISDVCKDGILIDFDAMSLCAGGKSFTQAETEYNGELQKYIPEGTKTADFLAGVYGYTDMKEEVLINSRCIWDGKGTKTEEILNYFT